MAGVDARARPGLVRRGSRLIWITLGYNALEAGISLVAGFFAGSLALVGFGVDSVIEVSASGLAQWRLGADDDPLRRRRAERLTRQLIGGCFLALATYVLCDGVDALWMRERPSRSVVGIVILGLSVVVMPLLARMKRDVAHQLQSRALESEARQTSFCAYLSAIALGGVALNAFLGWWWADPLAALVMVPIIAKEGLSGVRAGSERGGCCD